MGVPSNFEKMFKLFVDETQEINKCGIENAHECRQKGGLTMSLSLKSDEQILYISSFFLFLLIFQKIVCIKRDEWVVVVNNQHEEKCGPVIF